MLVLDTNNPPLIPSTRHYGFQPKACRPYRAKTKGKVERPFRYVREDFFLGRSFRNLDDLNAQFRHWLDTVANRRRHATTGRIVLEHFAEEKAYLKTLPTMPFNVVLTLDRRVTGEGMVSTVPAAVGEGASRSLVLFVRGAVRWPPAMRR